MFEKLIVYNVMKSSRNYKNSDSITIALVKSFCEAQQNKKVLYFRDVSQLKHRFVLLYSRFQMKKETREIREMKVVRNPT